MEELQSGIGKMSVNEKRRRTKHAFHNLAPEPSAVQNDPYFDPNHAASSVGLIAPEQHLFSPSLAGSGASFPSTFAQTPGVVPGVVAEPPQDSHKITKNEISTSLSVSEVRNRSNEKYLHEEFHSFEHVFPPISGTSYKAQDQYNATPKFARMSMYSVPYNEELKNKSKIPLAMELNPFADMLLEKDESVPQIDVREVEFVPRCRRCRAYLSAGMKTSSYDTICNICGFKSPLPSDYFSNLDFNGNREDYQRRPELFKGVVDYIVPKEYNWNELDESNPMYRVFLIDISFESFKTKVVEASCNAIRTALYDNMGQCALPKGSKIAIIGYDTSIHFFDLSPDLDQTSVCLVNDLDDPFLPFIDGLFVDPIESAQIIDTTLMSIEQQIKQSYSGCAFGAALKAACLALTEYGGGQILSTLSQIPIVSPGKLNLKVSDVNEIEWIKSICTPSDKYYQQLLKEFVANNVALNLFVAPQRSVDLGNLGNLAVKSGGTVREWYHFDIERDEVTFMYSIKEALDSIAGYQCQLKVRCSHGLIVKKYYGGFKTEDDSGMAIAILNVGGNTTMVCEFGYNGELNTKNDAHFQAALLYTSADGVRKVRVINSIVSITQRIMDVFSFSDQDVILKLLLRESLDSFQSGALVGLKNSLLMKVSDINGSYRLNVSNQNVPMDNLILPSSLNTLPMMLLSVWKSKAYSPNVNVPDIRLSSFFNLMNLNSSRLSVFLYPILICLHSLEDDDCITEETTGMFKMPKTISLTLSNLQYGGAYLIFNGMRAIIWLHRDVNILLLKDLFGDYCDSIEQVGSYISQLPRLDTHISNQVRALLTHLTTHYFNLEKMSVEVCRFGMDQNEVELQQMFVEDQNSVMDPSYAEFLKIVHDEMEKKIKHSSQSTGQQSSLQKDDGVSLSNRFGF